jgi:hypothetical protein
MSIWMFGTPRRLDEENEGKLGRDAEKMSYEC